jgi:protein-S-isoprenylcysteine O-methyltransferase Ste14
MMGGAFASSIHDRRCDTEEKLLAKELSGYLEYRNKVRRRLIPFVW